MAVPGTGAKAGLTGPEIEPASPPSRWRRIETLFYVAADMDPAERPAFLQKACGDDGALRQEVESLLSSADQTLGLLQKPVQEVAQQIAAGAHPTKHIGAYELIKLIGSGGMGDVYLAERADRQFRQRVAIKLMRSGVEKNPSLLPRFRGERQILANLDHPGIGRLLDGGMTPEGLPYFVMEFVDGVPIDEYCRSNQLSTAQRLVLFRDVCAAVDYAHRNLVVHRDIKPANVLVTANGIPKLLDFGIAKLLDPESQLLEPTRATQRLMTPEYASPEQIRGKRITTASDVYGLGVLLYELLTGKRPFRKTTGGMLDLATAICEQPPVPPSQFVKVDPKLAAPDASKWNPEIDAIILKALRKEPEARYQSAAQFSADVAAYMDGYPLSVHSGDWTYRTVKFLGRHKTASAAVAAGLLILIGFSVAMAQLAHRATIEMLKSERESKFLVDMFKAATPEVARGHAVTARDLLDQGAKRIDSELASVPSVRASMLHSMAEAYESLGLYDEAKSLARRAYDLKRATLGASNSSTGDSLFLYANLVRQKGAYAEAEPLFRELVALRARTEGKSDPAYATSLSALGECLYLEGKDAEAEPLLRKALAIYRRNGTDLGDDARNYLALLLERKGDYQEASLLLKEAVEITRRTDGPDGPNYATSLHNLSSALIDTGDLNGAEARLRQTLEIRRRILGSNHPMLAYTLNNLGYVLLEKGNWPAAEPFLREALEVNTRRLGEHNPSVAGNLSNWGRLLQAKGDYEGAETYFHKALDTLQMAGVFSSWPASQIYLNLGLLDFDRGRYESAENWARQSLEMRRRLGGEKTPAVASALIDIAEDEVFQGDPTTAEPMLREALEIRRAKYPREHPAIIAAEVRLGEALTAEGKTSEAESVLRDAVALALAAPFPLPAWQGAEAQSALAACLMAQHRNPEAEELVKVSQPGLQTHPRAAFRKQAFVRLSAIRRLESRP